MKFKLLLMAATACLLAAACNKETVIAPIEEEYGEEPLRGGLLGTWTSTVASTETCYTDGTYKWTENHKDHYHTLTFESNGNYTLVVDLSPDADNLTTTGCFAVAGDSLRLENSNDCLISHLTDSTLELEWREDFLGCGFSTTYYQHFYFVRK